MRSETAGAGSGSPSGTRDRVQSVARTAWLRRLASVGLLGYAVIHLLLGWLAITLAWMPGGNGRRAADTSGALALVAQSGVGGVLLWTIAAGLAGLCLWQAVEVLRHHRHLPPPGPDRRQALLQVVKTVGTACFYGYLAVAAVRTAVGDHQSRGQEQRTVAGVLGWHGGQAIVIGVAVVVAVIGGYLVQKGLRLDFANEIALDKFGSRSRRVVLRVSQIGLAGKGVALVLVGVVVCWAAVTTQPNHADGLDGALRVVAAQPFGQWMLTAIAVGLAAFAVYCLARARHPVG